MAVGFGAMKALDWLTDSDHVVDRYGRAVRVKRVKSEFVSEALIASGDQKTMTQKVTRVAEAAVASGDQRTVTQNGNPVRVTLSAVKIGRAHV